MGRSKKWPPTPYPHAPSGQERVRIDGKDIYLGSIGSDEAKRKYADIISQLTTPPAAPPNHSNKPHPKQQQKSKQLTIVELIQQWHDYAKDRYGKGSKEAQQYHYSLAPLIELHGSMRCDAFALSQLDEVRESMIAKKWTAQVINRRMVRIRTMWRWAERKSLVPPGSWAALSALGPIPQNDRRVNRSKPRKAIEWPVFAKVCRHMRNKTARAMMLLLWYTGARPSEIRLARVGEIDRSGGIWVLRPTSHKNAWRGQEREILIGPKGQKVLRPFIEGKDAGAWVFPSKPGGKHYNDPAFAQSVNRACERVGITGVTPYSCRHSFKARVSREMSMDAARSAMGHASIDTTAGYARGVDSQTAEDVARRLG